MNTEANIHKITDLPLEILNYLCTHLTWLDVVMLELAIPNLRMEQCGIHYDFKLKKLKQLVRYFRKLKRKQHKYHEWFRFTMFMYNNNPKFCLQSHMAKAISVIRKQNHCLYLIKKVEEELQVKFLVEEDIDVFCSYCETRFLDVDALETHTKIIFPKCRVISIEDLQQWFMM
jgi:hypothetical protein